MVNFNQHIQKAEHAQSNGNLPNALAHFQQALQQDLNNNDLLICCGNLSVRLEKYEEAAGYFRRLLLRNKNPDVRNALCFALQALGNQADRTSKYTLAAACFEEALMHQPNNPAYWYNLGNAQRESNKPQAALNSFQQAATLDPNDADTYNNLGNITRELGQLDTAIANYKKALALNPNLYHALVHLVHQKQHICDWQGEGDANINQQIKTIRDWVMHQPAAKVSPFAFIGMPSSSATEQKQCANNYVSQHYAELFKLRDRLAFKYNADHLRTNKPKLNIGYLSADFRLHPLVFLITELIEQHDKNQFNVIAYSYGAVDDSPERKRLKEEFTQFNDIRHLNDIEAAQKINADKIDILVDLTGFTQSSRTGIVALKPAPISVNWLGFPGTMGEYKNNQVTTKPLFDYMIADKTIAPEANEFSEQLIYLPCYQPNNQRLINSTSEKLDHGLPESAFVFCCFNQTFKISETIFSLWMRLLKKTPNSILWLMECNKWAKENLIEEAAKLGVSEHHLIFAPRVDHKSHMERQQHADLFLDTLPYNAHTTASDALAAGLPVITCQGDTFASKVAASLLLQLECQELICQSLDDYEKKAIQLASQPDELMRIKQKVNTAIKTTDLFKPEKFSRLLEAKYQHIWQTYQSNAEKLTNAEKST